MTVVDHKDKIRDVLICFQNILEVYSGPAIQQEGGGIKIEIKGRDIVHHLSDWSYFVYADKYFKKNGIKLFNITGPIDYLMSGTKITDDPAFHKLPADTKVEVTGLLHNPVIGYLTGESLADIQKTIKEMLEESNSEEMKPRIKEPTNKQSKKIKKTFKIESWYSLEMKVLSNRNLMLNSPFFTNKEVELDELGFINKKNGKPIKLWTYLEVLADERLKLDKDGFAPMESMDKKRLADQLKIIFEMDEDPFENNPGGFYKPKFIITSNRSIIDGRKEGARQKKTPLPANLKSTSSTEDWLDEYDDKGNKIKRQ